MTTALDILRKHFCGRPDEAREWMRDVFRVGDLIMATNGHWAALADPDASLETADIPPVRDELAPRLRDIALAVLSYDGPFIPATQIGVASRPCPQCEGSGRLSETQCDECDGLGNFWHGSHRYECDNCDGEGEIRKPSKNSADTECYGCDGSGRIDRASTHGDAQSCRSANSFYVRQLRAIGGEISPELMDVPGRDWRCYAIRFPGGRGLMMSMRATPIDPAESDLAPEAAA